jgi:calcineurin-like phosphoesterase family protein
MALRIHILSDLHIEHGGCFAPRVDCDLVVVAGDLANGRRMSKALHDLGRQVATPAVYVPGNHDWYQCDLVRERSALLRAWRQASPVRILDDATWSLAHGGTTYRIIGSTWWSAMDWTEDGRRGADAFAAVSESAAGSMNDFRLIGHDGRPFQPADAIELHRLSTLFIVRQIAEARAAGEVPIVVTHFLPSVSSCHPEYRGSLLNAYFANARDDLTIGVPLWIHGHTHKSFDYVLPSGCRVVCNPRGYFRENEEGFVPSLVVNVV